MKSKVAASFKNKNMTNYQNDIMDLLQGETPRQKYEYLKMLIEYYNLDIQLIEAEKIRDKLLAELGQ